MAHFISQKKPGLTDMDRTACNNSCHAKYFL